MQREQGTVDLHPAEAAQNKSFASCTFGVFLAIPPVASSILSGAQDISPADSSHTINTFCITRVSPARSRLSCSLSIFVRLS